MRVEGLIDGSLKHLSATVRTGFPKHIQRNEKRAPLTEEY